MINLSNCIMFYIATSMDNAQMGNLKKVEYEI